MEGKSPEAVKGKNDFFRPQTPQNVAEEEVVLGKNTPLNPFVATQIGNEIKMKKLERNMNQWRGPGNQVFDGTAGR